MKNCELIQTLHKDGYRCIRSCGATRQYRKAHETFTVTVIGCDDDCTPLAVVARITQKTGLTLASQA